MCLEHIQDANILKTRKKYLNKARYMKKTNYFKGKNTFKKPGTENISPERTYQWSKLVNNKSIIQSLQAGSKNVGFRIKKQQVFVPAHIEEGIQRSPRKIENYMLESDASVPWKDVYSTSAWPIRSQTIGSDNRQE